MISQNLMNLRKLHRYTLEDIAEKIGVTRQAVSKWESGETQPDLENCIALAKLFDVTLDNLVTYSQSLYNLNVPPKGKHFFGVVKVGERGQLVIPKKAREIFQIQSGDELLLLGDEEQGLALTKTDFFLHVANEIMSGGNLSYDRNTNKKTK